MNAKGWDWVSGTSGRDSEIYEVIDVTTTTVTNYDFTGQEIGKTVTVVTRKRPKPKSGPWMPWYAISAGGGEIKGINTSMIGPDPSNFQEPLFEGEKREDE